MSDAPAERRIHATVELREALGSDVVVHFTIDARQPLTDDVEELAVDVGTEALEHVERRRAAAQSNVLARLNPRTDGAQGRADRAGRRHPPPALLRPRDGTGIYGDASVTHEANQGEEAR